MEDVIFYIFCMKKTLFVLAAAAILPFAPTGTAHASDQCSYTITRDIQYGTGLVEEDGIATRVPLYLDVYLPEKCQGGSDVLPIPIGQIHGGGFVQGDKHDGTQNKIRYAEAGYAVFAINYRLLDDEKQPVVESLSEEEAEKYVAEFTEEGEDPAQTYGALVAVEDAIKAKEFVQKEFEGRIDTRWFLQGGSAGAFTTVNMAYLADYVFGKTERPMGIIEISGGISDKKQYLNRGDANMLIIHGTADKRVSYEMSDRLVNQAKTASVPYQRITALGSGHGLTSGGLYDWKVAETGLTVFEHVTRFIDQTLSCAKAVTPECRAENGLELTTEKDSK